MVTEYIPFALPFAWQKMSLSPSVGGTFTLSMIISISAQPVSIGKTVQSAVNVTAMRDFVASLKVATVTVALPLSSRFLGGDPKYGQPAL